MKDICIGKHLIIDYYNCDQTAVNSAEFMKSLIHEIAERIGVIILQEGYHEYAPVGITGFAIVSESHISIHTWPEYNYVGMDIFSCKDIKLDAVFDALRRRLNSGTYDYRYIDRVSVLDMH